MNTLLANNRLLAVIGGGFFLILAAILFRVFAIHRLRLLLPGYAVLHRLRGQV